MKVWKSRTWQRPIQAWRVFGSANKFANRAVWWHLKPKKWSPAQRWTCWAVKKSTWCTRLCFQRLLVGGWGRGLKTFWTKDQSFSLFPLVFLLPNLLVHFNFRESIGKQWGALHRLVWCNFHERFIAIALRIDCLLTVVEYFPSSLAGSAKWNFKRLLSVETLRTPADRLPSLCATKCLVGGWVKIGLGWKSKLGLITPENINHFSLFKMRIIINMVIMMRRDPLCRPHSKLRPPDWHEPRPTQTPQTVSQSRWANNFSQSSTPST